MLVDALLDFAEEAFFGGENEACTININTAAFEDNANRSEARRAGRLARGQAAIRGTERLFRPQLTVTPMA